MAKKLYLVSSLILPDAILKTAKAKEILARGEARTINEAVELAGISRSAFYKYKDGIFPFPKDSEQKLFTLSLLLMHQAGVLSKVLNSISEFGGNIITINQSIPVGGIANVSVTIEATELLKEPGELIKHLAGIDGVNKIDILS